MTVHDFMHHWEIAYWKIGSRYFMIAGLAFIAFYFIFKKAMLSRKVQEKLPKSKDYFRDVFYSVISIGIFAAISVSTFSFIKPYTNMYNSISDYGLVYYGFTFIWMFFLHDAYFYWIHRLMHHPKIFKYVHLIHHRSTNPTPWTAYALQPSEAILEALIVPVIAFSIPTHQSAIIFYMVFQISYNVYGHLGYELFPKNFNTNAFGKWVNTSVAHNMHHKYFVKNYGLWTTIWDRMMGTMSEKYDDTYERITSSPHPEEIIAVKQQTALKTGDVY